ncbi:MAG: lysophospholipase [Microlunatus sp.]|nr:lysophospholipase [Microlunatus sp.]MDN5804251.1 lysophospholipase [Microlunatus sp.]
MTYTTSTQLSQADGLPLTTYAWEEVRELRGVVQLAHGLAEHAGRYDRLARVLNAAGYLGYAHDHRGHGATGSGSDSLGSFGAAGWDGLVADVAAVGRSLADRHPGLPVFLLGHSMGSFAAQQAILDHSDVWSGVVLSGTTALDLLVQAMAGAGGEASGDLSAFNAGFEHRTGFEWLSRDAAEVDAYVADPWCGFEASPDAMAQMFGAASRLADPDALATIRRDLPLLIVSGEADPLAGGGALVQAVGQRYSEAGISDVSVQLFSQARHEIFNEINRDEITALVVDWLDAHTP